MSGVGGWGPTGGIGRYGAARRLVAGATCATVASLTLLAVAARADAHAELVSTEPAAGEQLGSPPGAVVLHFTEGVDLADDTIEVLDADGHRLDIGDIEHPGGDAQVVSAALPDLADGAYVVAWRVVSSDSHPIGGAFTFRVGEAGAEAADDETLIDEVLGGGRHGDAALGVVFGVVRFVAFAGVTTLVGALVFVVWLWPAGRRAWRTRQVVAGAWLAAVVATVLCIPLQAAYAVQGTLADALDPGVVADELGTRTGRSWLARLAILGLVAGVLPRLRRLPEPVARAVTAAAGLALVVTVSTTGHAVSGDLVPLAFVADVVHLSAVSVWLGGLALLVLALLMPGRPAGATTVAPGAGTDAPAPGEHGDGGPGGVEPGPAGATAAGATAVESAPAGATVAEPGPAGATAAAVFPSDAGLAEIVRVVTRFSSVAFAAVVAIVVTGVVQGWRQVGSYDALLDTAYGRLLVLKVALVAAMLVGAAASRGWVRARAGGPKPPAPGPGGDAVVASDGRAAGAAAEGSDGDLPPAAVSAEPDGGLAPAPVSGAASLARLRRSVAAEAGLAVAVLAVTALLVNAVPGRNAAPVGGGGPFSAEATDDDIVLLVEVDPAEVGPVAVHLSLTDPTGAPVVPEEVQAAFELPERDLGPITVTLVELGPGHYTADGAEMPFAGKWELEVVVRTSDIDQTRFDVAVPVA